MNTSREHSDALEKENAVLRERLARATAEAELFRAAAYRSSEYDEQAPTEAEILELLKLPHDQKLRSIIEEHERELES